MGDFPLLCFNMGLFHCFHQKIRGIFLMMANHWILGVFPEKNNIRLGLHWLVTLPQVCDQPRHQPQSP